MRAHGREGKIVSLAQINHVLPRRIQERGRLTSGQQFIGLPRRDQVERGGSHDHSASITTRNTTWTPGLCFLRLAGVERSPTAHVGSGATRTGVRTIEIEDDIVCSLTSFAMVLGHNRICRGRGISDDTNPGETLVNFTARIDLQVEALDDGFMVLIPEQGEVVHLEGRDAEAFALARGGTDEVPDPLTGPMAGLVELGLVATSAWDRRRVLQLGGATAAAAIAVIALPSVAAAASHPGTTTQPPTKTLDIAYLVVGGGGSGSSGGGAHNSGAGGGAGGVLEGTQPSVGAGSYPVTVGGSGYTTGRDSSLGLPTTLTAACGGNGGFYSPYFIEQTGRGHDGGSGGGGEYLAPGGSGIDGQGHDGGAGFSTGATPALGGGGGGYGGPGAPGDPSHTSPNGGYGTGGDGKLVGLAEAVGLNGGWVGGGGAGAGIDAGTGGLGGGGDGGFDTTNSGLANTGGGGGGIAFGTTALPGAGGSGVVVVGYTPVAGLTTSGGTLTAATGPGGMEYRMFTTSGTFTVSTT